MYGILVQSPSFAEAPLGPRGAADAECSERPESRRPSSPGELQDRHIEKLYIGASKTYYRCRFYETIFNCRITSKVR